MQTQQIVVERAQALELFRKYREHQHWSEPIDDEVRRCYQVLAQGKLVIRALESIKAAGLGEDGLPKLALIPATATECWCSTWGNGSVQFRSKQWTRDRETRGKIDLPAGSFPDAKPRLVGHAIVPLIPIHLRPKRGLANYHILWEAVWRPVPPVDPMLLRRIGKSDLWLVVAQWDLTVVEQAALATRVAVQ